jgi:hypothetical protein
VQRLRAHVQQTLDAIAAPAFVRNGRMDILAVVGDLDLGYEVMKLVADEELTMFVFTAEAGSRSEESLNLLASWAATEPATLR